MDAASDGSPHWQLETSGEQNRLTLSGDWTVQHGSLPRFPADGLKAARPARPLVFDTAPLGRWNSALITFLWEVRQAAEGAGIAFDWESLPPSARKLLDLLPTTRSVQEPPHRRLFNPLAALGGWTLDSLTELGILTELTTTTAWNSLRALTGRSRMRGVDLLANVRDAGPHALAIVGIVNFLIGAILAFVGAVQLQQVSPPTSIVADLVGMAVVREMAAVMTAIIMSGRTGGAYAARIATMRGNEEIDALQVVGIPVSRLHHSASVLALIDHHAAAVSLRLPCRHVRRLRGLRRDAASDRRWLSCTETLDAVPFEPVRVRLRQKLRLRGLMIGADQLPHRPAWPGAVPPMSASPRHAPWSWHRRRDRHGRGLRGLSPMRSGSDGISDERLAAEAAPCWRCAASPSPTGRR